ncbi:hypothetical protein QMZ92_13365 [Streptomyces sp. HNM0645]|nr:hypothetical protein [Streptomyces sp. HNM0645]MDI9885357.1 hypothetical protein [Streptomyces sp. HNM0645]
MPGRGLGAGRVEYRSKLCALLGPERWGSVNQAAQRSECLGP